MTDGKAVTTRKLFSRETTISETIHADPDTVWVLLTNAPDYARWNSTVISIEGDILPGGKIQLKSTLDENRTFNLAIKEFRPVYLLAWGDSMGTRTYTLDSADNNTTHFTMTEKLGGPIFPLFSRFIPDFDESFEQFTADLKREAEANPADSPS